MRSKTVWSVLLVALAAGVVRIGLLPAEQCPVVDPDVARATATDAVGWFVANQGANGTWPYRIEEDGTDLGGYDEVRHAGVMLSLYQADGAGIEGALAAADAGLTWATAHLTSVGDDGQALAPAGGGPMIRTGGSALLAAALLERRAVTGDPSHDALIADLASFLSVMVEPTGVVLASYDRERGRPIDETSVFATGQVMWVFVRLNIVEPTPERQRLVDAIGGYLPDRDDAEDRFPPTSDHWAAYAFADIPGGRAALTSEQRSFLDRQADVFGLQVRMESTRWRPGATHWLRRGPAPASGVGTLGEGIGGLLRVTGGEPASGLAERMRCVAGMLVERQHESSDPVTDGAWFTAGESRMDAQQHALSALLAAAPTLTAGDRAVGGGEEPRGVVVVAVTLLAVVNPFAARRGRSRSRPLVLAAALAAGAGIAALSGPVLTALALSPATARLAAGGALVIGAAATVVQPRSRGLLDVPALVAMIPVLLASGADDGVLVVLGSAVAVASVDRWTPDRWRRPITARLVAGIGLLAAADLVVAGVFGV